MAIMEIDMKVSGEMINSREKEFGSVKVVINMKENIEKEKEKEKEHIILKTVIDMKAILKMIN